MEHIHQAEHRVWGWPAVANFVIGGMAAGFYLLLFWDISFREGITFREPQTMILTLLSPLLLVLGFLFMTLEAGRPLRGIYILRNLKTSWMSREVFAGTLFALTASINWIFPYPVLYLLSVGLVVVYLISQGFIIYHARAVTAWNATFAPILFLTSGIVAGCGLLLIVTVLSRVTPSVRMVMTGLACLILNLCVYGLYALWPRGNFAFRRATAILRNPVSLIVVVGMGHLVPFIFLILLLPSAGLNETVNRHVQDVLGVSAGLAIIGGGAFQKIFVVLRGNSLRDIIVGQPRRRYGQAE